jgi:phosphoribosylamine---glycine ligase
MDDVNILVIGSGAREHALGFFLSKSRCVRKVFFANGNAGTLLDGFESIPIEVKVSNYERLAEFALEHGCITVVGPEEPLANGIVDVFNTKDAMILGPSKSASMIESSKAYAKEFMQRHGIPTARFKVFDDPEVAKDYISTLDGGIVVKADGLAYGKGVIVCSDKDEAYRAVDTIMNERVFGAAGEKVIVEERLYGYEASFICLSDGRSIVPLASSQDHKRLYDNDHGPNTGGMGAYSPNIMLDSKDIVYKQAMDIMKKAINGLRSEGREFKGFLYAGLMVCNDDVYVLEFNARLGDPECQVILPRLKSDLLEYVKHAIDGDLDTLGPMVWDARNAVCVVVASNGYPFRYEKGKVIEGLRSNHRMDADTFIFHAGTALEDGKIVTNGGRVLSIVALDHSMRRAIEKAYNRVSTVRFDGMHYRKDIGVKALIDIDSR